MNISTVSAKKEMTINRGNYENTKIEFGITAVVGEGETLDLGKLWQTVNQEVDYQASLVTGTSLPKIPVKSGAPEGWKDTKDEMPF